ncbi:hypothetical protein H7F15_18025 [Pontibacter sp. Tf4]|uniref:hypothetical protein n=1 Tax=Pontibacter sp. Tf4 TaxID=2761620 RepID=UPI00162526EB|nr:hypothetical protein [Pontibacter sp. Tf4]MBB6612944.1 hypothetical protein [Pontibacter sp. Tf4]
MKNLFLTFALALIVVVSFGQSRKKGNIPFEYHPNLTEDRYNQRITNKTIPTGPEEFVILSRKANGSYAVEKYMSGLDQQWSTALPLTIEHTVYGFYASRDAAIVVAHTKTGATQQLHGYYIDLASGALKDKQLLQESPVTNREPGIAFSQDGSKLLVFHYQADANYKIRSMSGALYDAKLSKIKNTNYNLNDLRDILSVDVQVSNSGEQYLSLISDNMNRLTVRQYNLKDPKARVMSVLVGGVFNGKKVYIMDSRFKLMADNQLYGAVITAEEATGLYHSLKAVKFDFENEDMVFAQEFRFTDEFLAKVNALNKSDEKKPTRFVDLYLSDLFRTTDNKLIVLAEKKYTMGGKTSPYFAKEMLLFAYDEYMNSDWNSVLMKNQQAPAEDAFSGISYSAYLNGNTLNLLTLEELDGKYDLYLRQIDTKTGQTSEPKGVRLNVANDKELAYVKDFTAWFSDKDVSVVVRPKKREASLKLYHIQLK